MEEVWVYLWMAGEKGAFGFIWNSLYPRVVVECNSAFFNLSYNYVVLRYHGQELSAG